jgi:hypothetical protein
VEEKIILKIEVFSPLLKIIFFMEFVPIFGALETKFMQYHMHNGEVHAKRKCHPRLLFPSVKYSIAHRRKVQFFIWDFSEIFQLFTITVMLYKNEISTLIMGQTLVPKRWF